MAIPELLMYWDAAHMRTRAINELRNPELAPQHERRIIAFIDECEDFLDYLMRSLSATAARNLRKLEEE